MIDRGFKDSCVGPDDVVFFVDGDAVAPPQGLLAFQVPRVSDVEFAQVNGDYAKGGGGDKEVRIERVKNFQA